MIYKLRKAKHDENDKFPKYDSLCSDVYYFFRILVIFFSIIIIRKLNEALLKTGTFIYIYRQYKEIRRERNFALIYPPFFAYSHLLCLNIVLQTRNLPIRIYVLLTKEKNISSV